MTNLKELDESAERLNNLIDSILYLSGQIADLTGKEGARELEDFEELNLEKLGEEVAELEDECGETLKEIEKFT